MIIKVEFENLLSFHEKTTLDFTVSHNNAEIIKENIIADFRNEDGKKMYILKDLILFGSNASGKSNLMNVIILLNDVIKNQSNEKDVGIPFFEFTKNKKDTASLRYQTLQIIENKKYVLDYVLELDEDSIIQKEELKYYQSPKTATKKIDWITLFSRTKSKITSTHLDLVNITEKIKQNNLNRVTLLNLYVNDINFEVFDAAVRTVAFRLIETLYQQTVRFNISNRLKNLGRHLSKNPELRQSIVEALNDIDICIDDFKITDIGKELIEYVEKNTSEENKEMQEQILKEFQKKTPTKIETIHRVGDQTYPIDYAHESDGTKMFINIFAALYYSWQTESFSFLDEIEENLHTYIQRWLIERSRKNTGKAQTVYTTHNILLLDQELFGKEQIVFVQKNHDSQHSTLYKLSDFRQVQYGNHKWAKLYEEGRLGSVPVVIQP